MFEHHLIAVFKYHILFRFAKQINMFEFANSIMSEIYTMMFDEVLPRVLEEMKSMMQSSPEDRVGEWFLYKDFTVLRIYGFT